MTALAPVFQGQQVRIVLVDDEPWFVAKDVCDVLGIANSRDALTGLDSDEKGVGTTDTLGGPQAVSTVSESGLYSLIFRSRRPEAVAFRRWVTHDVLPQIRRTGSYSAAPAIPTNLADALQLAADIERDRQATAAALAIAAPKAELADALMIATGDYAVREAAQVLSRDPGIQIGQNRLFDVLREVAWIDRHNIPYQAHVDLGRVVARTGVYTERKADRTVVYTQVRVTPKGLAWLHRHLGGTAELVLEDSAVAGQLALSGGAA